jgi:hypothetical protein
MENKELKKTPSIFGKKLNNINKSRFLKENEDRLEKIKHYSPSNKEWLNSVYAFNSNSIKNLPIYHNILVDFIESYFNLFFKENRRKSKRMILRWKRLSVKRIFFSKPEIKHTNDKINITIHVYNEQKRFLLAKLMMILNSLNSPISLKNFNTFLQKKYTKDDFLKIKSDILNTKDKKVSSKSIEKYLMSTYVLRKEYENILKKSFKLEEKLSILKKIFNNYNNIDFNLLKNKLNENIVKKIEYLGELNSGFSYLRESKLGKLGVSKILVKLWKSKEYYEKLVSLNNSKFKFDEKGLLLKLSLLISKIYNKKVEFNFVNIKNIHLNSDIFTKVIALKLKDRKNSLYRILRKSLRLVKLPNINRINFKYGNISHLRKVNNNIINTKSLNEDGLNNILLNSFPHEKNSINNNSLEKIVLNSLYYKGVVGVRLEVKGRLTKRFTASRSVFKVKWKGTLKDIYSSYRGLSSTMLRGHMKSNVQYSVINSKRRNGAFGVKGWINSSNY